MPAEVSCLSLICVEGRAFFFAIAYPLRLKSMKSYISYKWQVHLFPRGWEQEASPIRCGAKVRIMPRFNGRECWWGSELTLYSLFCLIEMRPDKGILSELLRVMVSRHHDLP